MSNQKRIDLEGTIKAYAGCSIAEPAALLGPINPP